MSVVRRVIDDVHLLLQFLANGFQLLLENRLVILFFHDMYFLLDLGIKGILSCVCDHVIEYIDKKQVYKSNLTLFKNSYKMLISIRLADLLF